MDVKATLFSLIYFVYTYIQVSAEYWKSIDLTVDPNGLNGRFENGKMSGWQIHEYGGINSLQPSDDIDIPAIRTRNEVLVEVYATSVNPLDQLMTEGYGERVLNTLRWINKIPKFPIILGREFSGIVKAKGRSVKKFNVGDKVFGVVPPHKTGAQAEYVVVDQSTLAKKPENINDVEAAGILYAGLTAWSSMYISGLAGGLQGAKTSKGGGRGKRICVLGASGGVGSTAVQIAKAEGMHITATCSTNSVQMVKDLGADYVIDYRKDDLNEKFRGLSFDIILDAAGQGPEYATKFPWKFGQYITLEPPILNNTDSSGLIIGSIKSAFELLQNNIQTIYGYKGLLKWGFFIPAAHGIEYLRRQVEAGKIKPITDTVYSLNSTKEAFQRVADGHLRGKIIITVK